MMSASAIELPLFPLDVVLFPGMVLPLHVFEPRYRQMISECHEQDKPFGIVLARPDSTHLHEEPHSIGTSAEIRDLDKLPDGRFVLMAVGLQRFRILSHHRRKPYLSGIVELYVDRAEPFDDLVFQTKMARNLFSTYLEMLLEAANEPDKDFSGTLPGNPEELSHFISYFLEIPNDQKQRFLEMTSTRQRLQEVIAILRREIPFMRQIMLHEKDKDRSRLN
jgi:Lon protease-like protein